MFVIREKIQERIIEFKIDERMDSDHLHWNIELEVESRRGQEEEKQKGARN